MNHHFLCFLLLATFYLLPIQPFIKPKINGFTTDLIHRDSYLSPFYNTTAAAATTTELAKNDVLRSIARVNHFGQYLKKIDGNKVEESESSVFPISDGYLMKFYIGTPPVEVLAIADTGSDLVWIQCSPCPQCYRQDRPLFNPMQSSTYMQLSCDSSNCQNLKQEHKSCGSTNNECEYSYKYGDDSYTFGVLTTDTFIFESTDGQLVAFSNSVFGCGHKNNGIFDSHGSGLVGLGGGPLSLVSQLGAQIEHKFSYCLQPRTAKSASKLRFGTNAVISGDGVVSTPILSHSDATFYYLNLESVSIGSKNIVNNKISPPGEGNIIIDSGTTLTMLNPSFYFDVEAAVKEVVGLDTVQDPNLEYGLCYDIRSSGAVVEVVTMVFHFTGYDVELRAMNIFREFDGMACLAMVPTKKDDDVSILGNVAQMNFHVEYDLANKMVSFASTDCTLYSQSSVSSFVTLPVYLYMWMCFWCFLLF